MSASPMSASRTGSRSLCLTFIVGLTLLGCGDSTAPEPGGVLRGVVVDGQGDPVPGAHINFLGYQVVYGEPDGEGPSATATLEPRDGTLLILDHLGNRIRVIEFTKDDMVVAWDGRDDDGRSVPSGVYKYVLSLLEEDTGETETFEKWLGLVINDAQKADTWVERADDTGRFTIRVERIPVWEDYGLRRTRPDSPDLTVPFWFSTTVTVRANRPGVSNPRGETEITIEDPAADLAVTLTLGS